jgi:hypothetical protein
MLKFHIKGQTLPLIVQKQLRGPSDVAFDFVG